MHFYNKACPTSQISLQLPDVLDQVLKLHLSSLEEILRLRQREHTLFCADMLEQWSKHKKYLSAEQQSLNCETFNCKKNSWTASYLVKITQVVQNNIIHQIHLFVLREETTDD